MSAGIANLVIEQGATWHLLLTYIVNDAPVDLSGYTARMQARKTHAATSTELDLTDQDAITLGSDGTIEIDLSATATASLTPRQCVYDIELEKDRVVTRLLEGTLKITPEVTR